jgi:hypothetical protein
MVYYNILFHEFYIIFHSLEDAAALLLCILMQSNLFFLTEIHFMYYILVYHTQNGMLNSSDLLC